MGQISGAGWVPRLARWRLLHHLAGARAAGGGRVNHACKSIRTTPNRAPNLRGAAF